MECVERKNIPQLLLDTPVFCHGGLEGWGVGLGGCRSEDEERSCKSYVKDFVILFWNTITITYVFYILYRELRYNL
jgi:hypothetical protein